MLRKLRPRSVYDVCAAMALFVALGGTAYAVNTVGSADIIDGEVKSVDVGDAEIKSADVKDESLTTFDVSTFLGADVVDGTLTGADVQDNSLQFNDIGSQAIGSDEVVNDSLLQSDIRANAVTNDEVLDNTLGSADIADNSLTGTDINESSLSLPQTPTTASFSGVSSNLQLTGNLQKVFSRTSLPAGNYAIVATVNMSTAFPFNGDQNGDYACELRNNNGFIGGATDRRIVPDTTNAKISLSMNGGAVIPAGGAEISIWCLGQVGGTAGSGQVMFIRLDGFF